MKDYWDKFAKGDEYSAVITDRKNMPREEYDESGSKHYERYIPPLLAKHGITNPKELTILDLGCGTGRITQFLAKNFKEAIGTDVSEELINKAHKDHQNIPNMKFYLTSGEDLKEIGDESIDIGFSFATLQHIPNKKIVIKNFKEVYRALKTGGKILMQVRGGPGNPPGKPIFVHGFNKFYAGIFLWRNFLPILFVRKYDPLLGACFSPSETKNKLATLGFSQVEAYYEGPKRLWIEAQK
jgi:ubiquinone/menaquinone biosynthesis C-methylase UbiE